MMLNPESRRKKIAITGGLLILLVLGAFFIWKEAQAPTKESGTQTTPTVTPAPDPTPGPVPTPDPVPTATAGTIMGHVDIGPFCPVQRSDTACPPPPGTYDGIKILIYDSSGKNVVKTVSLDASGNYRQEMPAGDYQIDYQRTSSLYPHYPEQITVIAGQTHEVDFSIDTGIR